MHMSFFTIYRARTLYETKNLYEEETSAKSIDGESKSDDAHGDFVVTVAFIINLIDAILKFIAAYFTGSKSLFAEGIHTSIDTLNQAILFIGIRSASRKPSPKYPYGYGNIRYVTALMAGCGIFCLGCGLSIYHGVEGILEPHPVDPNIWAPIALAVSGIFSGASAIQAIWKTWQLSTADGVSFMKFVLSGARPGLNVVLLEDTAAVLGVLIAAIGYYTSEYLESTLPDAIGSIMVGILLAVIAMMVIRSNTKALLGKAVSRKVTESIISTIKIDPVVHIIEDVNLTCVGDNERFKAEVDFNGKEITKRYLETKCDMNEIFYQVKTFDSPQQLKEFLIKLGEGIIDQEAFEIDRIEEVILKSRPSIKYVDLEPL